MQVKAKQHGDGSIWEAVELFLSNMAAAKGSFKTRKDKKTGTLGKDSVEALQAYLKTVKEGMGKENDKAATPLSSYEALSNSYGKPAAVVSKVYELSAPQLRTHDWQNQPVSQLQGTFSTNLNPPSSLPSMKPSLNNLVLTSMQHSFLSLDIFAAISNDVATHILNVRSFAKSQACMLATALHQASKLIDSSRSNGCIASWYLHGRLTDVGLYHRISMGEPAAGAGFS